MVRIEWGEFINRTCNRCGKTAKFFFIKKTIFKNSKRFYCKNCILEVLQEQRLENTKLTK